MTYFSSVLEVTICEKRSVRYVNPINSTLRLGCGANEGFSDRVVPSRQTISGQKIARQLHLGR